MHQIFVLLSSIGLFLTASCGVLNALTSTTHIGPEDSFVLGDNQHGAFRVHLQNVSLQPLTIHLVLGNDDKHSPVMVPPGQALRLKVPKNTAVVIANSSRADATVKLKVLGDKGLSMSYKK